MWAPIITEGLSQAALHSHHLCPTSLMLQIPVAIVNSEAMTFGLESGGWKEHMLSIWKWKVSPMGLYFVGISGLHFIQNNSFLLLFFTHWIEAPLDWDIF